MKPFLLAITLLLSLPAYSQNDCSFYQRVSNKLQCSSQDYFIRFGEKYCQLFVERKARFTSEGQVFLRNVRQCLIQKIASGIKSGNLNCSNIEDLSMDHHIECYVHSGFCTLAGQDRQQLFLLTWRAMLESNVIEMAWKINSSCNEELSRPR